jgi:hypothetical protein
LSTGRTRQCWDNALAESFFASLKGDCLDQQLWPTRTAARRATVEYIGWYNGTRLHSALGYQTPNEFEATTDGEVIRKPERAISPVRQSGATPVRASSPGRAPITRRIACSTRGASRPAGRCSSRT